MVSFVIKLAAERAVLPPGTSRLKSVIHGTVLTPGTSRLKSVIHGTVLPPAPLASNPSSTELPLCKKEIDWLKKKDAKKGNISFIDITLSDYDPSKHKDIGFEQGMRRAHAITKDGEVVTDMEVFRRVYRAVGLGWVFAFTTVQPFSMVADTAYTLW
eukprot:gene23157-30363_t